MTESVVQSWVKCCSLKQQTIILESLRGCDGVTKNDPSKSFVRAFRSVVLVNADVTTSFMAEFPSGEEVKTFITSLDPYPMHWLFHFMQSVESVGYKHHHPEVRQYWNEFYLTICRTLHIKPESENEFDERLK